MKIRLTQAVHSLPAGRIVEAVESDGAAWVPFDSVHKLHGALVNSSKYEVIAEAAAADNAMRAAMESPD